MISRMRKADVTPLYNLHITVKIKSGYFQVPVQIYQLEQAVQYNSTDYVRQTRILIVHHMHNHYKL